MSKFWTAPRVFISYTWHPEENKARALALAEDLRSKGFDARIDVFFQHSLHGFSPPQPVMGDPRNAWVVWAEEEIRLADCVLLLCTEQYRASEQRNSDDGVCWADWSVLPHATRSRMRVPFVWWDWQAMVEDWSGGRATGSKYVPAGFGPYGEHRDHIPAFLGGATYCNLDATPDFTGLLRRIRAEHRKTHPRAGVFISYAHRDDPVWIDTLLEHLEPIRQAGVRVWTDRGIEPGERWHDEIQGSLAAAKAAVLLASPSFLESHYITEHELPGTLQAAESDGLKLLWVPVLPADWQAAGIAQVQAAHPVDKPLSTLSKAELKRAYTAIVGRLAKALGVVVAEPAGAAPAQRPRKARAASATNAGPR